MITLVVILGRRLISMLIIKVALEDHFRSTVVSIVIAVVAVIMYLLCEAT